MQFNIILIILLVLNNFGSILILFWHNKNPRWGIQDGGHCWMILQFLCHMTSSCHVTYLNFRRTIKPSSPLPGSRTPKKYVQSLLHSRQQAACEILISSVSVSLAKWPRTLPGEGFGAVFPSMADQSNTGAEGSCKVYYVISNQFV